MTPASDRLSSLLFWCQAPLLSGACWLAVWLSVPNAEFPLADEWAFGRGAFEFAAGQGIHYHHWASMPLLGQWIWAWPFIKLLGPSYFSLRLSVICLSWLGLVAFQYLLIASARAGRTSAALATIAFALSPLFFMLQGVFLTDLASLSFALIALAFYEHGRKTGSLPIWLLAALPATLAAVTRQNMLTVPAIAAAVLWRQPRCRREISWWLAIGVPLALATGVYAWFQQRPDARLLRFNLRLGQVLLFNLDRLGPPGQRIFADPTTILLAPFVALIIAGLIAVPVLLIRHKRRRYTPLVWALAAVLAAQAYWYYHRNLLPYGGLYPFIHGMMTPSGAYSENLMPGTRPIVLSDPVRGVLTGLGCIAAAALLEQIWLHRKRSWSVLTFFAVFQVPFLFFAPWLYDRYLLVFLPGLIAVAVGPTKSADPWAWPAAIAWLAGSAAFSIALVHDWYSWNLARWQLGARAVQVLHIHPRRIEGGFEWDGAHNEVAGDVPIPAPHLALKAVHFWFPMVTGEYAISFTPLEHSVVIGQEPYHSWLGGSHDMLLLEQQSLK